MTGKGHHHHAVIKAKSDLPFTCIMRVLTLGNLEEYLQAKLGKVTTGLHCQGSGPKFTSLKVFWTNKAMCMMVGGLAVGGSSPQHGLNDDHDM